MGLDETDLGILAYGCCDLEASGHGGTQYGVVLVAGFAYYRAAYLEDEYLLLMPFLDQILLENPFFTHPLLSIPASREDIC